MHNAIRFPIAGWLKHAFDSLQLPMRSRFHGIITGFPLSIRTESFRKIDLLHKDERSMTAIVCDRLQSLAIGCNGLQWVRCLRARLIDRVVDGNLTTLQTIR